MKKGFTLIELIMVIVILGIISMFGADLYSQIYRSYLHTRAINQLEARTQNAITLISNRLEYRIAGTTIGRVNKTNNFVDIASITTNHDVLEWIGQSIETKNINNAKPGWSGFIDLKSIPDMPDNPAVLPAIDITTQGSALNSVAPIINNITNKAYNDFVIIFKSVASDYYASQIATAYGYDGTNRNFVANAKVGANDETLTITNYPRNAADEVEFSEQYYLAHSAYALYPDNTEDLLGGKNFDLKLAYNYQPWKGGSYANAPSALIAEDVFMFRFRDDGGSISMKLCMRDNGRNFDRDQLDMIMCKSQVVY